MPLTRPVRMLLRLGPQPPSHSPTEPMTTDEGRTTAGTTAHSGGRRGNPWRIAGWSAAALLLLFPLVAMQFTDEVNWTVGDFVFAGVLLLGVGIPLELAAKKTGNIAYRAAVGIALVVAFLIVWISLAVGIIGSEDHPANLLYAGALAVGGVGSVLARFRPHGMARAMVATALVLIGIAVAALAAGWGSEAPVWPWPVVILNGFFAALLAGSAALFRQAAQEHPPAGAGPVR